MNTEITAKQAITDLLEEKGIFTNADQMKKIENMMRAMGEAASENYDNYWCIHQSVDLCKTIEKRV
jgi:hypothetical protein